MQPRHERPAEGSAVARVVADRLRAQLEQWERRQQGVSESALAALALKLAEHLDDPSTKATAAANVGSVYEKVLDRIESGLPPLLEGDEIDELKQKRDRRRSA